MFPPRRVQSHNQWVICACVGSLPWECVGSRSRDLVARKTKRIHARVTFPERGSWSGVEANKLQNQNSLRWKLRRRRLFSILFSTWAHIDSNESRSPQWRTRRQIMKNFSKPLNVRFLPRGWSCSLSALPCKFQSICCFALSVAGPTQIYRYLRQYHATSVSVNE